MHFQNPMAQVMKLFGRSLICDLQRAYQIARRDGVLALVIIVARLLHKHTFRTYRRWIALYDTLDRTTRQRIEMDIARLPAAPMISVIVLLSGDDTKYLDATVRALLAQLYPHWELCLAVDRSAAQPLLCAMQTPAQQDGRIRIADVEDASAWADKANAALKLAAGDFVALADPGDALSEQALYWVAKELAAYPEADLLYSDEDKISRKAGRFDAWFKPDWNPALMLSCNAFGRLGIFRRSMLERLAGFHAGFEGAEEYELVLRCARASELHRIRHIARILYHRRADAGSARTAIDNGEAGRRAIAEHLTALNIAAEVRRGRAGYQVVYAIPSPRPRVSIIVATTARPDLVEPCLKSLFERTNHGNWEVLLLVKNSVRQSPERDTLLNEFAKWPGVRVVEYPDRPFNYSWVNNLGAAQASGEILCFLNDDTEAITADWLDQLVARVSLPQVAAAGPTLYYPDGTIQHAGVILGIGAKASHVDGLSGIAGHACCHQPRSSFGYFGRACLEQDVSCVTAACMAIRADVFRKIGGFDEAMPLAFNDVDLCLRLRAAGWRIIWTPMAELVHHESASLGRHNEPARAEQFARDVALMRQRWQHILNADPFYNRNLSLERTYELSFPPRLLADDNLLESRQARG